jgi:hypothetical protein
VNDDLSTSQQDDPAIAVDSAGNAYAVWTDRRNGIADIYFSYCPAVGDWSVNIPVDGNSFTLGQYHPDIAVDGSGNAYAIWVNYLGYQEEIDFAFRPVGGNWSASVQVTDTNVGNYPDQPAIAVDNSGNAYAVWMDERNGDEDIFFAYRPAGGVWGANILVNDDFVGGEQAMPDIAVDSNRNAYALWADYRDGYPPDIYFSYRPVHGNWSTNIIVNDDNNNFWQHYPTISVDASGNAYAVWVDDRDGDIDSDQTDIYFSYRPSSGSWGENIRVNDFTGDATQPDIGVDNEGNVYVVWEDWRISSAAIYFASSGYRLHLPLLIRN